jgi:hypothetical protein
MCTCRQMDNRDKDYRYMACSDLANELAKVRRAFRFERAPCPCASSRYNPCPHLSRGRTNFALRLCI